MRGQRPLKKFLLVARGPGSQTGMEGFELVDSFDDVPQAVAAIPGLFPRGPAKGAELVIIEDATNRMYDAGGNLIAASGAA